MSHRFEVSPAEAADWLARPGAPVVLDVRTPAEFAHGRIAGAVNVPVDLVEQHPDAIAGAIDRDVLLVCRADPRARRAATAMAGVLGGRGHVLTGGMTAWNQQGLPVEQGHGAPWAMERQVRTAAGTIVLASILGSTRVGGLKWLAAGVGTGLVYSGLSDTCGMAALLSKAPWNHRLDSPTVVSAVTEIKEA